MRPSSPYLRARCRARVRALRRLHSTRHTSGGRRCLQHGPNSDKWPGPVPVIYFALLLIAQHVIGFADLHESRLRPWSARGFSVIPSTLLCDMPAHLLKLLSSLRGLVWVLICTQCGSVKQKSSLRACASAAAAAPGLQGPHLGATSRQASCMPACASTSSSVGARCRRTRLALWRVRQRGEEWQARTFFSAASSASLATPRIL